MLPSVSEKQQLSGSLLSWLDAALNNKKRKKKKNIMDELFKLLTNLQD